MRLLKKTKTALSIGPIASIKVLMEKIRIEGSKFRFDKTIVTNAVPDYSLEELLEYPLWIDSDNHKEVFFHPLYSESELSFLKENIAPESYSDIVYRADKACKHEFSLLGSGPTNLGNNINWQKDFISGYEWEIQKSKDILVVDLDNDADIKVPWELSRHQHFVTLGQAYLLTGNEKYANEFVVQASDWIEKNPPYVGVNWICAMDAGFRAISWIYAKTFFASSHAIPDSFWTVFDHALAYHGEFIINNIEDWGTTRNNHYVSNGTALVYLGIALQSTKGSDVWYSTGKQILESSMEEQVLDDGVDYEMSTSYHRLVLECLLYPLVISERTQNDFSDAYKIKLLKMLDFVQAIIKPNGNIPLFGDADDGRCVIFTGSTIENPNDHRYLLSIGEQYFDRSYGVSDIYANTGESYWLFANRRKYLSENTLAKTKDTGVELSSFGEGGFYVMQGFGIWLMADFGPRGIPGAKGVHGHNDATSFELNINSRDIVVDSGTYTYSRYPSLHYYAKSSAAHNILLIDNEEISTTPEDLWVIGDEAQASIIGAEYGDTHVEVIGQHHGYERFGFSATITRSITLRAGEVVVEDKVDGNGVHELKTNFHTPLFPSITSSGVIELRESREDSEVICTVEAQKGWVPYISPAKLAVSYGVYRETGWVFGWSLNAMLPAISVVKFIVK